MLEVEPFADLDALGDDPFAMGREADVGPVNRVVHGARAWRHTSIDAKARRCDHRERQPRLQGSPFPPSPGYEG